jgi:hypothetical protein
MLFHEIQKEEMLPNQVYKASITLILKSGKDVSENESYGQISSMSIDAKIFNEIFASRGQQHIKKITHHYQVSFRGAKDGTTYSNNKCNATCK